MRYSFVLAIVFSLSIFVSGVSAAGFTSQRCSGWSDPSCNDGIACTAERCQDNGIEFECYQEDPNPGYCTASFYSDVVACGSDGTSYCPACTGQGAACGGGLLCISGSCQTAGGGGECSQLGLGCFVGECCNGFLSGSIICGGTGCTSYSYSPGTCSACGVEGQPPLRTPSCVPNQATNPTSFRDSIFTCCLGLSDSNGICCPLGKTWNGAACVAAACTPSCPAASTVSCGVDIVDVTCAGCTGKGTLCTVNGETCGAVTPNVCGAPAATCSGDSNWVGASNCMDVGGPISVGGNACTCCSGLSNAGVCIASSCSTDANWNSGSSCMGNGGPNQDGSGNTCACCSGYVNGNYECETRPPACNTYSDWNSGSSCMGEGGLGRVRDSTLKVAFSCSCCDLMGPNVADQCEKPMCGDWVRQGSLPGNLINTEGVSCSLLSGADTDFTCNSCCYYTGSTPAGHITSCGGGSCSSQSQWNPSGSGCMEAGGSTLSGTCACCLGLTPSGGSCVAPVCNAGTAGQNCASLGAPQSGYYCTSLANRCCANGQTYDGGLGRCEDTSECTDSGQCNLASYWSQSACVDSTRACCSIPGGKYGQNPFYDYVPVNLY